MPDKQTVLKEALAEVMSRYSVPFAVHKQVIDELNRRIEAHEKDLKSSNTESKKYLEELKRYSKVFSEYSSEVKRLTSITHLKGEKGDDGYTPKKGTDYFDGQDAEPVNIQSIVSIVISALEEQESKEEPKELFNKEDLFKEFVARIQKEQLIDVGHLRNFSSLKQKLSKVQVSGSGVPSLTAGTNITLTQKSDGGFIVTALGGGAGATVVTQVVTGVQVGADVTIALSQLTHFATMNTPIILLARNDMAQTPGLDFTETATVVTVPNASASDIYYIIYSYA